ncbi:MAG: PD-(D/E)XK nuclease family protein [Bacteroidetes bacterium]|uniref:PD-(D/E)XK nuclease family protein n=1 Tax=Candidatus Cryptobacteroides faecipullorum TaxID=2840764 RepID=A0A9D9I7H1_9BACT|nr:PD-(D/E)XK nuclease family protein [Candidatus Cryptobacteroides faecipullorum]
MSSKYETYTPEQLEEHFSNYLMDSWSYSKVSCFARNEKAFEKHYIYMEPDRRSSSSVAGNAYHAALEEFFSVLQMSGNSRMPDIVPLEQVAFAYINDSVEANQWKLHKTTPTVDACIEDATKKAASLVRNFYGERDLYMSDLMEVTAVESRYEEWVTVNGVDIPLPCHAVIDLVVRLNDGRVVIIDHKGKGQYSDEKEVALVHGKQAITYVLAFEKATGIHVDGVWFIENKYTANKDGSPQLRKFEIWMDADSRRLYEAMLYEPLRRMIEAVSDPDYIYTVNDNDSLSDKAELYAFWARTMIAEVDDFNIPDGKKGIIEKRQRKIKDASLAMISPRVITGFSKEAASFISYDLSMTDMSNGEKIHHILMTFGMNTQVTEITGFSSDTYLLEVSAGVKIGNIYKYRKDIANALNVPTVRIPDDLAIHEGKSYVAIEASKRRTETLKWDVKYLQGHRIPVGMDNFRNVIYWDMDNHSTPHLLVCGSTGSGKSVELRSILEYALAAGVDDVTVFDPKYEFCDLASETVKVYNESEDMYRVIASMVADMQSRPSTKDRHLTLLVIDEFADIMDSKAPDKGGLTMEQYLKMLAQKGRSLGFRIIAATQRASTKVITGDTKVNFPVQICFRMPKAIDSQVVIDEEGAEALQGQGDGLIKSPEYMDRVVRFQGFYKA